MGSKQLIQQTEFFNGLLLVCASGIGNDLNIPDDWPDGVDTVSTKNAVLFDFRNLANDGVHTSVSHLSRDLAEPHGARSLGVFHIEAPNKQVYVGDVLKKSGATMQVPRNEYVFSLLVTEVNTGTPHIYLKDA